MGMVLGVGLVFGIVIGVAISLLLGITAVFMTARVSKLRRHVWQTFCLAEIAFLVILFVGVHHYPHETGTPGSNYNILFLYFFFSGLAYTAVPGIATLLAFLTTLLCPKNPSANLEASDTQKYRTVHILLPLLSLFLGVGIVFAFNGLHGLCSGELKVGTSSNYGKEMLLGACRLSGQGKHSESINRYSDAIESGSFKGKELGDIYVRRGWSYNRLGNNACAMADFERAVQLNPEDANAFNGRGWSYVKSERYPEALADFNTAIRLSPRFSTAFNNRGVAFKEMGRRDLALENYRKAIELNNDPLPKANALFNLGWLDYQDNRLESALACHNQGIGILPDDAMGYNDRGVILEDMGQREKARADYSKAIELGNDPEAAAYARLNRGTLYLMDGDYVSANNDFSAVFKDKLPMRERAAALLFISLKDSGKKQGEIDKELTALTQGFVLAEWPASALKLFQSHLSLDEFAASYWHPNPTKRQSQQAQMWFYLGQHLLYLGQDEKARDCFERCLKLDNRDSNEWSIAKTRLAQIKSRDLTSRNGKKLDSVR
ncbi:MAG: hypothetical protein A2020_06735 [Lentisphaerae bacterium GWF2_45_14]|nr:MAG: hypothetical protein A2020_06735 [Lentisphaerae bacterium GWF2_45_14]